MKYLHVKSHQDDETDVHFLPWTAQMHVLHADALATDYLVNYAEPSKSSHSFLPPKPASPPTVKLSHGASPPNDSNKQL